MKSEFLTPHAKVLLAVKRNPGLTVSKTLLASGLAPNTFYKVKAELLEDGLIREVEDGGKLRTKRLYPTEKGSRIAEILSELEQLISPSAAPVDFVTLMKNLETEARVLRAIKELEESNACVRPEDIAKTTGLKLPEVDALLKALSAKGMVYEYTPGCYKVFRE